MLNWCGNISKGQSDPNQVVVAVVDTGVDLRHSVLSPLLVPGFNFLNSKEPPQDHLGHGTKVVGVVAAVWGTMSRNGLVGNGKMAEKRDSGTSFAVPGLPYQMKRGAHGFRLVGQVTISSPAIICGKKLNPVPL
jgi:subtilisin family serine protease